MLELLGVILVIIDSYGVDANTQGAHDVTESSPPGHEDSAAFKANTLQTKIDQSKFINEKSKKMINQNSLMKNDRSKFINEK